jgi:hypothetical protein
MNAQLLANGIQLAIAPVFLLTALAAILSALATRLGRVIDRARALEALLEDDSALSEPKRVRAERELGTLSTRARLINWAMGLLVGSSLLIGITILELFLGEIGQGSVSRLSAAVPISFISALAAFILALFLFLAEVLITTRSVRIGVRHKS